MSRYDNLMRTAEEVGAIERVDVTNADLPTVLVAPIGNSVPEDGILTYVTVDTFKQLLDVPAGAVVLFHKDQESMLATYASQDVLFGVSVSVLYGAPGSDYDRWFEEATFEKKKISYAPLVSEIRISKEVDAAKRANEPRSVVEKEESQYRRADGSVRYDEKLTTAAKVEASDDSELG